MGMKTKIDWCDATWNPVTGCLHGCEYCYARRIAKRFSCEGQTLDAPAELQRVWLKDGGADLRQKGCHVLRYPVELKDSGRICPYPFAFAPTFHRYKLDEPQKWKKPRTIFVCSMADLFGSWVPDEWIKTVFDACDQAPQHRYMFLTKNPTRYIDLDKKGLLPRQHWYGYTATKQDQLWSFIHACECPCINLFVSIEPIQEEIHPCFSTHTPADWVIIGAETGNRKDKIIPKKSWIDAILEECIYSGVPIFMKESLRDLMGPDFRQEFPW